jgi:DNA-binding GntR family transcriptional regulator
VRRGHQPTTQVLSFSTVAVDPVAAEALGVAANTPLVSVERLRTVGDTPTALMHNWLAPRFADLDPEQLVDTSLYALLRARGARPVIAHQTIGARRPGARERRLLGLAAGDPLLTMTRRAYAADGTAVEFGDHSYRYDQYAFDVTVHEG